MTCLSIYRLVPYWLRHLLDHHANHNATTTNPRPTSTSTTDTSIWGDSGISETLSLDLDLDLAYAFPAPPITTSRTTRISLSILPDDKSSILDLPSPSSTNESLLPPPPESVLLCDDIRTIGCYQGVGSMLFSKDDKLRGVNSRVIC